MSKATFEHSESLDKLGPALRAVQQTVEQPTRNCTNPRFESRYADLASCWSACRKALGDNGLALVQLPCIAGEQMALVTMLLHTSGQWMRAEAPLRPVKDDPWSLCSCITYMERYSVCGWCAMTPEEDDDGNAASGASGKTIKAPAAKPARGKTQKPAAQKPTTRKPPVPPPNDSTPFTREAIGAMIMRMVEGDKVRAAELFGQLTGRDSLKDLPDDGVESAYRTVRAHFVSWESKQEK